MRTLAKNARIAQSRRSVEELASTTGFYRDSDSMTISPLPTAAPLSSKRRHKTKLWTHKTGLWTLCLATPAVVLMAAGVYFAVANWPFRYRTVEPLLQEVFASQVKIGHYHRIYFLNPGFMATKITLSRNSAPDLPPLGSARSLTVQGTWLDLLLLRRRVRLVDITGLQIVLPPLGSSASHEDFPSGSSADFGGPTAVVEQLRIHESVLDIMRANGNRYSFPIRQLVIRNLQKGQALAYTVDMQNAKPTGHILSTGSFGPLNPKNLGATPLSGNFTFSRVNLRDLGNISGTLSSTGYFNGTLAAFEADAGSETPDFAVGNGKRTPFATSVHCGINGLNGDVILHGIDAKTGATTIHVEGGIVGSPKVIDVEMSVAGGRMQDLLRPLIHDKIPIAGALWFHSHAQLDPARNGSKFLQRLRMDGTFEAPAERLTNRATEQKLSDFSQRAQGVKPSTLDPSSAGQASNASADVVSSFKGQAKIRDGVLSTQRITLQMPGVGVDLGGSFNLRDSTVDLTGNLRMQSDISHTATGFKSALMKPLIPFFKKNKAGAVIPIAVTGGPGGYKVTQNLLHRK
jgi:hypothetical protein